MCTIKDFYNFCDNILQGSADEITYQTNQKNYTEGISKSLNMLFPKKYKWFNHKQKFIQNNHTAYVDTSKI